MATAAAALSHEPAPTGDNALVAAFREGDIAAFESLVQKYERRLQLYLSAFLRDEEQARELVQDTFIKVYKNAHQFKPERTFASWLFRIAHNVAVSYLRKRRPSLIYGFGNHDPESDRMKDDVASAGHGPHQLAESSELGELLRHEIALLPPKLREAFLLFDVQQMSIKEIAARNGQPIGTIKARVFRARRALRKRLAPYRDSSEAPVAVSALN